MEDLQKILDAAEQLFRLYGIRSVTMDDIARELGMSKKTIYASIENKDDLVERMVIRHIRQEKEGVALIQAQATNALEEMWEISRMVRRQIHDINPSLIFDLQRYHRSAWAHFEKFQQEFIFALTLHNLERGQQEALYRAEINPDFIARIHTACMPIFTNLEMFPREHYPPEVLHREYLNYHIQAIATAKGLALWQAFQAQG